MLQPARTFEMIPQRHVVHGENAVAELPNLLETLGASRPLIITGNTIGSQPEPLGAVKAALADYEVGVFSGCAQHVPRRTVFAAAEAAKEFNADVLISLGGGTPIDTAKAVALVLAANIEDEAAIADYSLQFEYGGDESRAKVVEPSLLLPHIALPTTISGGEYTHGFTVKNEATGTKEVFIDSGFVPTAVVLDPVLTLPTPLWLWLSTGIRSVDHAVEGFLSKFHHPATDLAARFALPTLVEGLRACKKDPENLAVRAELQVASWLSIKDVIANVRFGLSHAIGHQIGGRYDIPHGVTSCVMLPHALEFNASVNADRQATLAQALGVAVPGTLPEQQAAALARTIRELIVELELPHTLSEFDADPETFPLAARDVLGDAMVAGNPREIQSADEVVGLLHAAL